MSSQSEMRTAFANYKKDAHNWITLAEFRPIQKVQEAYSSRPLPDEPLCALLWEYKDRGKKGYDLTERFFELFKSYFPTLPITGPERAGRDILMGQVFADYPNPTRPVDFVIYDESKQIALAIGLARYDSDRGGAQEDDRTGGYRDCAREAITTTLRRFAQGVERMGDYVTQGKEIGAGGAMQTSMLELFGPDIVDHNGYPQESIRNFSIHTDPQNCTLLSKVIQQWIPLSE